MNGYTKSNGTHQVGLSELGSKYGNIMHIMLTWHMIKGVAETKKKNVFYPAEFYHPETYSKWAEIWEQLFNAFDPETGVDYISSDKGKTIADQRVVDPSNIKRGGCNIT